MTPEERSIVLSAVIQKAVNKGFRIKPHQFMSRDKNTGEIFGYETIIFDPDFARALWGNDTELGEEHECENCILGTVVYYPADEFHLRHLVSAPDGIAYLEKYS